MQECFIKFPKPVNNFIWKIPKIAGITTFKVKNTFSPSSSWTISKSECSLCVKEIFSVESTGMFDGACGSAASSFF